MRGLDADPLPALARTVARIEQARVEHQVDAPFVATMCASDGDAIYAVRYSSNRESRTLYHSQGPAELHAADGGRITLPDDARLLVSEPLELDYRRHRWVEVPDSSSVTMRAGEDLVVADFTPTRA